jgi:enediyne biosynthesis protein E4
VVGRTINRMGIGSKVRVFRRGEIGDEGALLGVQEIAIGYGYASGQAAICHFGLGEQTTVDVQVVLPNGNTKNERDVKANQRLVVRE